MVKRKKEKEKKKKKKTDTNSVLQWRCYILGLAYSGTKSTLLARLAAPATAPKRAQFACQTLSARNKLKLATKAFGADHPLTIAASQELFLVVCPG